MAKPNESPAPIRLTRRGEWVVLAIACVTTAVFLVLVCALAQLAGSAVT